MKATQAIVVMLAASLGACGGSGSEDGPQFTDGDDPSAAEGLYNGSTDQGQDVTGVVLWTPANITSCIALRAAPC